MTVAHAKLLDILDKHVFNLIGLPYATRHEILSYVCDKKTTPVFLKGVRGLLPTAVPLPSIARAGDRQLRVETILVAIKQTTLEVHSGPGNTMLQEWLSKIDCTVSGQTSLRTGFEAVHSLSFLFFSRFPHRSLPADTPNSDIKLMLKCPNLREISLNFTAEELTNSYNDFELAKPIEQLRDEYRLDSMLAMFDHGELRTVRLVGPGYALQIIAEWLRWEYAFRANLHPHLVGSRRTAKALAVLTD